MTDKLSRDQERIIATAEAEYGTGELPPGSNRGPCEKYLPPWKVEEYRRRDALAGRLTPGDPWCAFAATWTLRKALGRHPMGRIIGGVHTLALEARRRGMYLELSPGVLDSDMGFVVYPGCLFVMLDEPLHAGPTPGHTGIVTGVSERGDEISTAEGNTGNAFRAGKRSLRDPRMRGMVLTLGLGPLVGGWPRGLRDGADLAALGTR